MQKDEDSNCHSTLVEKKFIKSINADAVGITHPCKYLYMEELTTLADLPVFWSYEEKFDGLYCGSAGIAFVPESK